MRGIQEVRAQIREVKQRSEADQLESPARKRATSAPPIVHPPVDGPAYSPEGVDLTLIRWMLSLTPAERLQVVQRNIHAIVKLRHARHG